MALQAAELKFSKIFEILQIGIFSEIFGSQ